jgi:hypothetical protein
VSTKIHPKRGRFCPRVVTKSVYENSPFLSMKIRPLCPREVFHPSQHTATLECSSPVTLFTLLRTVRDCWASVFQWGIQFSSLQKPNQKPDSQLWAGIFKFCFILQFCLFETTIHIWSFEHILCNHKCQKDQMILHKESGFIVEEQYC